MSWEIVMGLEVHLQLATRSKIFSGSATQFGAAPNQQADAVDLGMPGMLPVLNEEAVRFAVKFGLSIGAGIGKRSVFDRKTTFTRIYPKAIRSVNSSRRSSVRGSSTYRSRMAACTQSALRERI